MTITSTVPADPAYTYDKLNILVAQLEAVHGALVGMGNDSGRTTLTFENTRQKPTKNAVIAPQVAGQNFPTGITLVCTGTVYILGGPKLSIATRVTPTT